MRIHPPLQVERMELCRPAPADPTPYTERFYAPVRFGCERDRLCFSASEWEAVITGSDAESARVLEEHARILAERLPSKPAGFVASVQSSTIAGLPESTPEEDVARVLHVSRRTLQRKLAQEGTSWRRERTRRPAGAA